MQPQGDGENIADAQGGAVVGFGVNNRQREVSFLEHRREACACQFHERFVGFVREAELVRKIQDSGGVRIVQSYRGGVNKHGRLLGKLAGELRERGDKAAAHA